MTANNNPTVSVILPAYYSHGTIAVTLDSLRRQTFRDSEVIVVNSSPEPETARLVETEYPEVLFIQSPARLYPHAARNYGAERALGDLLVFSDPDVEMHEDWLELLVSAWRAGHEAGGGAMGLRRRSWWECAVHLTKFHQLLPGLNDGERWIVPTANAFYSRTVWERVGPFPPDGFSGDACMSWMAGRAGFGPRFVASAVVDHIHGGNLRGLLHERFVRGLEFLGKRARFERWSLPRVILYLLATPWLPLVVLARTGGWAWRAGWMGWYLLTLPAQAAAHWAWSAGEAQGAWRLAREWPEA
jgi:GT2 family glycosyltransferase